ncbi:hypothetical protein JTB14_033719 [Gonioctena quinquepunctata]|nr:hypothetical protein JTB14_033719 [Gonioctena quinquepunctata]
MSLRSQKQQKISRHLETTHKNEEDVRKFMMLPKGNSERKHMIGLIRKKGFLLYNTNRDINEGDLIVTRRCPKNQAIKNLNKEVTDLTSVFDPKFPDDTVRANNETAKFNSEIWRNETPPVAFDLGTFLKQVGNLLTTECIEQQNDVRKKNCNDYLKVNISVNRTVAESNLTLKRRKTVNLPPMEDIKKLHSYLLTKRSEAMKELQNEYSFNVWRDLACLTQFKFQT